MINIMIVPYGYLIVFHIWYALFLLFYGRHGYALVLFMVFLLFYDIIHHSLMISFVLFMVALVFLLFPFILPLISL